METSPAPRWLHRWAVFTVAATVCLLALGAIVTTFQVGMADPVWPTYPWHLLLVSWAEPRPGFLIEHTHRLAGYLVGCCVIVLCVGLWLSKARRALKWLGVAALIGVSIQGLVGGFRVRLHELIGDDLKIIHGCFAQVVFGLFVGLAVLTAPSRTREAMAPEEAKRLRGLGLLFTGFVFLQLVWGALLRHVESPLAQRLHLITAFAVVAALVWLTAAILARPAAWQRLRLPLLLLAGFVTVQILLGVEAWLRRFGGYELPELHTVTVGEAILRTAHVLVGSWILATGVALTVVCHRSLGFVSSQADLRPEIIHRPAGRTALPDHSIHQLEGTA